MTVEPCSICGAAVVTDGTAGAPWCQLCLAVRCDRCAWCPCQLFWNWYGVPTLARYSSDRVRATWLAILLERLHGIPGGAAPVWPYPTR